MQIKRLWLIVFVAILCLLVSFFFLSNQEENRGAKIYQGPFMYESFLKNNPVFSQENTLTEENKYREMGHLFERATKTIVNPKERAYAEYLVVRAYVGAVLSDNNDTESLAKALDLGGKMIQNSEYSPDIRVYTLDEIDFLLFPAVSRKVKIFVIQHPLFRKFDQNQGDVLAFRRNLLHHGDQLHRMTNVKMKLALLDAYDLFRLAAQDKNPDSAGRAAFEKRKEETLGLMQEANASLQRDISGEAPFRNQDYTAWPRYLKAWAAVYYFEATHNLPFGEIDPLFQDALQQVGSLPPEARSYMESGYRQYQNSTAWYQMVYRK